MSTPPPQPDASAKADMPEALRRLDEYVLALETDPRADPKPYLAGLDRPTVEALAGMLAEAAFEVRQGSSTRTNLGDLLGQFPAEYDSLVRAALAARTTVLAPPTSPLPPLPHIHGYEVVEGEEPLVGGSATVFLARDLKIPRPVALKVLREEHRADRHKAFRDEARIQASLKGVGVPAVFDSGASDGVPYIAMEWVDGETLREKLTGPGDTWKFVADVCSALAAAHQFRTAGDIPQPISHLDLTPANVKFPTAGGVRILDWGLSEDRASRSMAAAGTPGYVGPEKFGLVLVPAGEATRTDVFAIGCLLLHALTGGPLGTLTAAGDATAFRELLADAHRRLDAAVAGRRAPPDVAAIAKRCLRFLPTDRPADAGEVAELFRQFQVDLEERDRRRRVLAVRLRWLAALTVVLALSAAVGWHLVGRVKDEQTKAAVAAARRVLAEGDALADEGKWYDAQAKYRAVAAEPCWSEDERFNVRLRVLRAATFLNDRPTAAAELAQLEAHPTAGRYSGRLAFERAIQLLGRSMEHAVAVPNGLAEGSNPHEIEAEDLLRRVRDDPAVPEADRWTARGLLAPTAAQALENYDEALRLQRFHPYALPYCVVTSLLAGRLDDALARTRAWAAASPRDPLPRFYKAFILTLLGRHSEADADLRQLGRTGGGRLLPLATLNLCTAAVKAARAVGVWLPEVAAESNRLAAVFKQAQFLTELTAALQTDPDAAPALVFAVPLSPPQRRVVGRFLTAAGLVKSAPARVLLEASGAESFVAEGIVEFVRAMALSNMGRVHEAAVAYKACADASAHLWDVKPVARLCRAIYFLSSARVRPEQADDLRRNARSELLRAAQAPGLSETPRRRTKELAGEFNDPAFSQQIDDLLDKQSRPPDR